MGLWKKAYNKIKKPVEWIEIPLRRIPFIKEEKKESEEEKKKEEE